MAQIIKLELVIRNNSKYDSCVYREGDFNTFGSPILHVAGFFEKGLRRILLGAFEDVLRQEIYRLKCAGFVSGPNRTPASSLEEVVRVHADEMEIYTHNGYITFSAYGGRMDRLLNALMLLIWKWSPHFASDNMDGTNDFSSSMRACVVCGKIHHGVSTGQLVGGVKLGFDPSPVREVIAHPYSHCFNPKCYSHEIEKMIDPAYVFVPPKPGEDSETELALALRKGVVKKDQPMGTGIVKKSHGDDPAVRRFEKDMK